MICCTSHIGYQFKQDVLKVGHFELANFFALSIDILCWSYVENSPKFDTNTQNQYPLLPEECPLSISLKMVILGTG